MLNALRRIRYCFVLVFFFSSENISLQVLLPLLYYVVLNFWFCSVYYTVFLYSLCVLTSAIYFAIGRIASRPPG